MLLCESPVSSLHSRISGFQNSSGFRSKNGVEFFPYMSVTKALIEMMEEMPFEDIKVKELCEETACLYKTPADYVQLLDRFGLIEKKGAFISELSGGQKQKLFIVLALIPDPKVVFLDELTTGLDPKARRSVWKSLLELKAQGLTIFLTSHYMDEVEVLCDRIGILKAGKLIFTGTVREAMEQSACSKFEDAYLWFSGEEADDE